MSDYDDYENNLFFPPVGDMSKLNDCNDGKRGSDVLVTTLEKCQKIVHENVELKNKLEIARKALEEYADQGNWQDCLDWNGYMEDSFVVEIGRFDKNGYTTAEEALEKIKEKKR